MGHISDHSRGRRDMSLALSVWRCGPIGLRPRACGARKAMLGHRYIYKLKVLESWHVCPRRFRGRVFMAGAFLGRGASNSTRNASPRPALPPGPGLAALLLSSVRAHAHGKPSQRADHSTLTHSSSIALPYDARPNASLGPRQISGATRSSQYSRRSMSGRTTSA